MYKAWIQYIYICCNKLSCEHLENYKKLILSLRKIYNFY